MKYFNHDKTEIPIAVHKYVKIEKNTKRKKNINDNLSFHEKKIEN
jgi:hypothetical protein